MSVTLPRCAVVASTAGSVLNAALGSSAFFRSLMHSVVCDRPCPAADKARAHGLEVAVFDEPTPEGFAGPLLEHLARHRIDYVFSFYTQFFSASVRRAYPDRLINLHPSLLPAFKGMTPLEEALPYGVRFLGSTVEFIKDVMDEGKIIMQTVFPLDPAAGPAATRHRLFVQQCKSLLQVGRWLAQSRVSVQGQRVLVAGGQFDDGEFSPALDCPEARGLRLPLPGELAGPMESRPC